MKECAGHSVAEVTSPTLDVYTEAEVRICGRFRAI